MNPKFEAAHLVEMKKSCQPHCFSTLNHIVAWCYDSGRVIRFLMRQAAHGFQGIHGRWSRGGVEVE